MVKLLKKDRVRFYSLFVIINIFCVIFLLSEKKDGVDLISSLTSANYITLVMNNIYIYYMFRKEKKIRSIYDKIICRIGQHKFFNQYIFNSIIDILVYFFITYFIIYLKVGINMNLINFFIVFLITNFCNFFAQELFSMLIFLSKKGYKYIVIPIIMNLIYYYYFIPYLIKIFTGY